MRAEAKSGNGWSCNWGIDFSHVSRREFIRIVGAASLTAMLPGCSSEPEHASRQEQATTVFTGGTVMTVDAEFSEAEAIAVRGNRILAVGTDSEVREAAGDGATIVTDQPRAKYASATCEPMNPAPPVTNTFLIVILYSNP